MKTVDLNSDMGESFGAWSMGDDAAMLDIVTSANIACGFHAGDPDIMARTATMAREKGVQIGAHPGFNDIWGFGRRVIKGDSMASIENMVAYQIGAMQAMAVKAGHPITYVKPHGALANIGHDEMDYAMAIARAIKAVDSKLVFMVMPGLKMEQACLDLGLTPAYEVFADRTYEDDGQLTSRKKPGSVLHDADIAAARVVEMVQTGTITSINGKVIKARIDTICVHGDNPAAVGMARAVRQALEAAGIRLKAF